MVLVEAGILRLPGTLCLERRLWAVDSQAGRAGPPPPVVGKPPWVAPLCARRGAGAPAGTGRSSSSARGEAQPSGAWPSLHRYECVVCRPQCSKWLSASLGFTGRSAHWVYQHLPIGTTFDSVMLRP